MTLQIIKVLEALKQRNPTRKTANQQPQKHNQATKKASSKLCKIFEVPTSVILQPAHNNLHRHCEMLEMSGLLPQKVALFHGLLRCRNAYHVLLAPTGDRFCTGLEKAPAWKKVVPGG